MQRTFRLGGRSFRIVNPGEHDKRSCQSKRHAVPRAPRMGFPAPFTGGKQRRCNDRQGTFPACFPAVFLQQSPRMNIFSNFFRRLFRHPKKPDPRPGSAEAAAPSADIRADSRYSLSDKEEAGASVVRESSPGTGSDCRWSLRGAESAPAGHGFEIPSNRRLEFTIIP